VPATDGLYLVDATARRVVRTPVVSLDLTRPLADVRFDGAAGTDRRRHGRHDGGATALTAGAALLASEQLGLCGVVPRHDRRIPEESAPVRPTDGLVPGAQAPLADVWVELTQARAVARYAAVCAATVTRPASRGEPGAGVLLSRRGQGRRGVRAAARRHRLHVGTPAHLFLKRAKADAIAFGTADRHRHTLASLVDLGM
jgi:hypothetical protein